MGQDLTDSIRVVKTLDEAKTKLNEYQEVFYSLPIGLYRTSIEDGSFLKANPECAYLLGYDSIDDLMSKAKSTDCYWSEEDREVFIDKLTANKSIKHYEMPLKNAYGQKIWVAVTARICEEKGYLEGSLMDISDRKRLEEEIEKYKLKEAINLRNINDAARTRCLEIEKTLNGHRTL